jgi:hypothetical protein
MKERIVAFFKGLFWLLLALIVVGLTNAILNFFHVEL